ncbi:MAG: hypothetical protein K8J08_16505 [Thermoanaerobaculia bacterium]|nr:hypothetical protein [Thermoanaerobaculia bacterium]
MILAPVVLFAYSAWGDLIGGWGPEAVRRATALFAAVSSFCLIGLILFFAALLSRISDDALRAKLRYSLIFGGPIGWIWAAFLATSVDRKVSARDVSDP